MGFYEWERTIHYLAGRCALKAQCYLSAADAADDGAFLSRLAKRVNNAGTRCIDVWRTMPTIQRIRSTVHRTAEPEYQGRKSLVFPYTPFAVVVWWCSEMVAVKRPASSERKAVRCGCAGIK